MRCYRVAPLKLDDPELRPWHDAMAIAVLYWKLTIAKWPSDVMRRYCIDTLKNANWKLKLHRYATASLKMLQLLIRVSDLGKNLYRWEADRIFYTFAPLSFIMSHSESEIGKTAYVDQCYDTNKLRKMDDKPDRLSALPDHLLFHILSSFEMKDVIRTGVLSKRWRLLWTSAHNLCFSHSPESNRDVTEFIKSTDDTLILSKPSKLNEFAVEFLYSNRFVDHVNRWMIFVKIKSVEVVDLNLLRRRGLEEGYSLPQLMYSNVCLRKMKLSNCNLVPKEGIYWTALRVLALWYAKLSLEVVDVICSGCPGLESLKFCMCFGVPAFHINSNSVKKLVIREYWQQEHEDNDGDDDADKELTIWARNVTSLEISACLYKKIPVLQNVQALVHAKRYFGREHEDDESDVRTDQKMLKDLLVSLGHVEKLSIGPWCLQVLTILESRNWRCPLMKCKYLTLHTRLGELERPGSAILLQSCPQVEILIISSDGSTFEHNNSGFNEDSNDLTGENYWISRPCWGRRLKTLRIYDTWIYESCYFEQIMPFLEAVLKNGIVLEKIILTPFKDGISIYPMQHARVTQKLLSFPRSSEDVVIVFSSFY
ncbi:hypothetical protein T459_05814 [Capsicum annuum]|uniref:F-box domain-containing protein n=1 Tax=Capsicum annuum TaxID=4072 RepID=A0A2G3A933_CAPAN|nr:hypothetical protein T459_05814 [Capsicum annuum]